MRSAQEVAEAIRSMKVRGAPAIGLCAAYGMVLAHLAGENPQAADGLLRATRPTAVNLMNALDRLKVAWGNQELALSLSEELRRETQAADQAISSAGAALLSGQVLTHCNTGPLGSAGFGTALGAIIQGHRRGQVSHVWVDETRPYLQGARLTSFELMKAGVPATLITDSMAAHFMSRGEVDSVIVGADRMALNGDFANKIGTYGLAILAHHHGIPFYVALPISTVDPEMRDGESIPIEERPPEEVTQLNGHQIAPQGFPARHPVFDITPHRFITAIITERSVLYPPFAGALAAVVGQA